MDTLTINGTAYRVECNFNAITAFMDAKGETDLGFLSSGKMSVCDWFDFMAAAINEGERLEGRKHDYTREEFGTGTLAECANLLNEFIALFSKQNAPAKSEEGEKKE